MRELKIGDTVINYTIRKSKKAKNVSIFVGLDGVEVVAPQGVTDDRIIPVVEKKREWIFNKVESFEALSKQIRGKFASGENLVYQGNNYSLKVVDSDCRYTRVSCDPEGFVIYVNKLLPLDKRQTEIRKKLEQWYIVEAKKLFQARIKIYKQELGVQFNAVRIRNQRTRWGSCSGKGNLNFNWRLVLAPIIIVDYVVVHELCHLKYMNHGREFWQLVESQIPDYKNRKRWLRQHGIELSFYIPTGVTAN